MQTLTAPAAAALAGRVEQPAIVVEPEDHAVAQHRLERRADQRARRLVPVVEPRVVADRGAQQVRTVEHDPALAVERHGRRPGARAEVAHAPVLLELAASSAAPEP